MGESNVELQGLDPAQDEVVTQDVTEGEFHRQAKKPTEHADQQVEQQQANTHKTRNGRA